MANQSDEPSSAEPPTTTHPPLSPFTPIPRRQRHPSPPPPPPQPSKPRRLSEFHLFPTLPQDLRLLIWSHTFPPAATFHISLIYRNNAGNWTTFIPPGPPPSRAPLAWITIPEDCLDGRGDWDSDMWSTEATYEMPVGLCVNWEIRRFVLGRYERLNVWDSWRAERWEWIRVWFLRDRDVLVFGRGGWTGMEGEMEGTHEIRGGVIGGELGVRRVWVVLKKMEKDVFESVEERKEMERERDKKQILGVQKAFQGVVEIGLVNRGEDRDFDWKSKEAVVIARKRSGGDWFTGEERIVCGNLEAV